METKTQLVLTMASADGEKTSLYISDVKADASKGEIQALAQHIIDTKCILNKWGDPFTVMVKAKVVEDETINYDLVI